MPQPLPTVPNARPTIGRKAEESLAGGGARGSALDGADGGLAAHRLRTPNAAARMVDRWFRASGGGDVGAGFANGAAALAGARPSGPRRRSRWRCWRLRFSSSPPSPAPGRPLSDWLGDTDDAVRLVTVRELIGGAPWFDTTLPRIGAPEPLVSHWSRLIDLPLAALIGTLTPLLGPERAELATRIVWPALLFFALALIVAREAHRRAGAAGAAFALMLVATSAMALAQFRPGRDRSPQRADPVRCRRASLPRPQPGRRSAPAGSPAPAGSRSCHRLRGDGAGGAGAGARRLGGRLATAVRSERVAATA